MSNDITGIVPGLTTLQKLRVVIRLSPLKPYFVFLSLLFLTFCFKLAALIVSSPGKL